MITNNQHIKFELSDGFIEVYPEMLFITDKAKKDRLLLLITIITSILLALLLVYKWLKTGDTYYSVVGIIILILNLRLFWKWYKNSGLLKATLNSAT